MTTVIVHPDGTVTPAIRKLTEEEQEIFSGAVVRAYILLPSFRDAIALMRPFFDATADTAYTDAYSRVGLSSWFFEKLDVYQRASVILHEAFHVLNNTFTRGAALGAEPDLSNISSDLEINCSLHKLKQIDLSFGIMPDKKPFDFPMYQTMEQYYHLIKNDPELEKQLRQNQPQSGGQPDPNCPQHGNQAGQDQQDQNGTAPGDQGQGNQPGDQGDGGQGDQPGDNGSGDGEGEGQGDGQGQGSGGSQPGQGQGNGAGQPSQNHQHGQTGPQCTCPHEGSGSGSGSGSGQGDGTTKGCDQATDARSEAADAAGVERASDAEQSIAKKNTAARMEEAMKKARAAGDGAMAEFLSLALQHMAPPRVNWRNLFRRLVSKMEEAIVRGRSDYSYRRTSRRLSDSKFIFPGMIKYQPKALMGIDTSGSMSQEDHLRAVAEVEGIMKATSRAKNTLKVFSVDTQVKNCKLVDSVRNLDLRGGGGTAMEVGWQFAKNLPSKEQPDIFILATDGYTHWPSVEEEVKETNRMFRSVILVTTDGGYKTVPESLKQLTHVIDISEGEN